MSGRSDNARPWTDEAKRSARNRGGQRAARALQFHGVMHLRALLPLLLATASLAACAPAADDADEATGSSEDALWAQDKQKWPAKDGVTRISVCWETDGLEATKAAARATLAATWSAIAKIDFVGFDDCGSGTADLRVRFAEERPHVRAEIGFGKALKHVQGGVTLNLPGTWCQTESQCDRAMVIHEFGHALGFLHEQDRDDAPATCPDGSDQHSGTLVKGMVLGSYDPRSVMNYCRYILSDATLSAGDIDGARKWYGKRCLAKGTAIPSGTDAKTCCSEDVGYLGTSLACL